MDSMFGVHFAPYGDILPLFKWNIKLQKETGIIDGSLQITLGKK